MNTANCRTCAVLRMIKECQWDEIATAIARCAGALAESGRAEPYGSSSKIFFEC